MATVFLSYSHDDTAAVLQISAVLARAGLEPWLDSQEIRSGADLLQSVADALTKVDYYLVVLSAQSLTKPWVLTEMRMALVREIEHGRPRVWSSPEIPDRLLM
jgi:hypothetical protein